MSSSNFIDYVKFFLRSGKGGNGVVHFRREKHVPKGGPDGGNGGRGGHIILVGNKQLWTLIHLKYRKHIFASDGQNGGSSRSNGSDGNDLIIEVPLGTVAKDVETGNKLLEITEEGQSEILIKGGRGGLGNSNFKSSTNQTPRYAQNGQQGEEKWVVLELKVLADVGLVGFPNAGKSTFLSTISSANPKIDSYLFTTLIPNLGVVQYRDYKSFVVADIPGIIEGASSGKGLGLRFLRHIERNSILLFMVSAEVDDIDYEYQILLNELKIYNPELLDKKRILAISKSDLLDENSKKNILSKVRSDVETCLISSVSNFGLDKLKDLLWETLNK